MEFLWWIVGAASAWLFLKFRAEKAAVRKAAQLEFAYFIHAIALWNNDRSNSELLVAALRELAVYDTRLLEMQEPRPADDPRTALMASFWRKSLADAGFLTPGGEPVRWELGPRDFWDSLDRLREERTRNSLRERLNVA